MILDEIFAHKRDEVAAHKRETPLEAIQERIQRIDAPRPFREALRQPGISLIAEVKRASPVKGVLLENMDPVDLAGLYEHTGARAISVLTDKRFFQGSLRDLTTVRQAVTLPCLRKEFIIDEYQIYEARAAGADAILLIVRMLSDEQLREYRELAESLGMDVLVEAHDAGEMQRALDSGAHILGINNRNLDTFEVDFNTSLELRRMAPGGHVLVSESGIQTRSHVRQLEDGGVDAILVGETLVTSKDIAATIRELLGIGEG